MALAVAGVVALAVAGVDAQEVAQVVEQKNFQHGLVVSESESSMIYKVTFSKATELSGQPSIDVIFLKLQVQIW